MELIICYRQLHRPLSSVNMALGSNPALGTMLTADDKLYTVKYYQREIDVLVNIVINKMYGSKRE